MHFSCHRPSRLSIEKIWLFKFIALFLVLGLGHASADEMIIVPESAFYMGQSGVQDDEQPIHRLWISSFFASKYEVSVREWIKIRDWAINQGYEFSVMQDFPKRGPSWYELASPLDFPMNNITWYDAVKWCNAKSEFHGRKPVYYLSDEMKEVYRRGEENLSSAWLDTKASGYRLPTEAEWEKMARGSIAGLDYPWGDTIDGSMANYKLSGDPFDDASTPLGYYDGNQVTSKKDNSLGGERRPQSIRKNAFGLFDVVGNVSEWCWDWYDKDWYGKAKAGISDTLGPSVASSLNAKPVKVHRGGGFKDAPLNEEGYPLRIAFRHVEFPESARRSIGLRTVRSEMHDSLWFDASTVHGASSNWFYLDWFGYFYPSFIGVSDAADYGWVFHIHFGWIYPTGKGSYDNWIYFDGVGWVWTSKEVYPYCWSNEESAWFRSLWAVGRAGWFERDKDEKQVYWGSLE